MTPSTRAAIKKAPYLQWGGLFLCPRFGPCGCFLEQKVTSQGPSAGPAIKAPTTQRAWRVLQVHHKDGPVRDASSKGGVEGAYLGPPLPAGRAPMGRATHRAPQGAARSAPESPGEASASSTMPTSSSHRSQHPSLAHLVASLGHGGLKIVIENGDASIEEQRKRVASYEMRARTSSGLPGGYLEALCAGARLKSAHSLHRSETEEMRCFAP